MRQGSDAWRSCPRRSWVRRRRRGRDRARDSALARFGADGLGMVAYRHQLVGSASSDAVSHCVDAPCSSVAIATVDASGDVGYRPSMTIAPTAARSSAYLDRHERDLKLAFCARRRAARPPRRSCSTDVAFSDRPGFGRTAVAIGADGRALVAYTDGEPATPPPPLLFDERLKVAHCEDASCTTRTTTNVLDALGQGAGSSASEGTAGPSSMPDIAWPSSSLTSPPLAATTSRARASTSRWHSRRGRRSCRPRSPEPRRWRSRRTACRRICSAPTRRRSVFGPWCTSAARMRAAPTSRPRSRWRGWAA